ncbi:hypothetical protein, partial [Prosthecobacter sp.]|uniref:hypothetical protein n=1 Tax=Prosthecobacter sp. TaxID=1965333 RepID=UPI003784295E
CPNFLKRAIRVPVSFSAQFSAARAILFRIPFQRTSLAAHFGVIGGPDLSLFMPMRPMQTVFGAKKSETSPSSPFHLLKKALFHPICAEQRNAFITWESI